MNYKIAIIVSKFNELITDKLLKGAKEEFEAKGVLEENIDLFYVPGAFEIPLVAKKLAEKQKWDAIVAIGAVIKGDTAHFEYVSEKSIDGISKVSLKTNVPIILGILTTYNIQQALDRCSKNDNKGKEFADAALEMIEILNKIDSI